MKKIYLSFSIWKIATITISFIAPFFVLSSGNYQMRMSTEENLLHIPNFLLNFGNFDGHNYLHIAKDGYGMYEQAYFPLFPLLIHCVSIVANNNYFLGGLLIANISFLIGLIFLYKYLFFIKRPPIHIFWTILFILAFPTSFFFGSIYTEGLFFLGVTSTLYFLATKRYLIVVLTATLTAMTRITGLFLILPLALIMFEQSALVLRTKSLSTNIYLVIRWITTHKYVLPIILSPILGIGIYMVYLYITTKDPLLFYHAQQQFNAGRSSDSLIFLPQVYFRYIKIFLTAQWNMIYFVSCVELLIFTVVLGVLTYDFWKLWTDKKITGRVSLLGLNLFSFIQLLLPTLTGTLSSTPRYSLLCISFFIRLSYISNRYLRILLMLLFAAVHIILLSFFSQGYFVS